MFYFFLKFDNYQNIVLPMNNVAIKDIFTYGMNICNEAKHDYSLRKAQCINKDSPGTCRQPENVYNIDIV